jgi:hypothetical protein
MSGAIAIFHLPLFFAPIYHLCHLNTVVVAVALASADVYEFAEGTAIVVVVDNLKVSVVQNIRIRVSLQVRTRI